MVNFKKYIEINPNIRFGRPVVKDTTVSVYDVLGWMARGMSFEDIIYGFPELSKEQLQACLAYAASRENNTIVLSSCI